MELIKVSDQRKMLDKQFQQIIEKDKLVTIEVATILEEILKQIKNDKSEFEKTYEQRIVIYFLNERNGKFYAEHSTRDSKFTKTIINP